MKELLQEQTTANQADNSDSNNGSDNKNWEREQIANTPFWIVGNQEQGYNVILGKWKLSTQAYPTKTEALVWLDEDFYNIILSMIICVTTDIEKQKQN